MTAVHAVKYMVKSVNERNPCRLRKSRRRRRTTRKKWRKSNFMTQMDWAVHVLQRDRQREAMVRKNRSKAVNDLSNGLWSATRPYEDGITSNRI